MKAADVLRLLRWIPREERMRCDEKERRNSIVMTLHYPNLAMGSTSYWLKIFVVTCHYREISALVHQTWFGVESSGGVPKCQLFSQVILKTAIYVSWVFDTHIPVIWKHCYTGIWRFKPLPYPEHTVTSNSQPGIAVKGDNSFVWP